jgi:hypothetical protein
MFVFGVFASFSSSLFAHAIHAVFQQYKYSNNSRQINEHYTEINEEKKKKGK